MSRGRLPPRALDRARVREARGGEPGGLRGPGRRGMGEAGLAVDGRPPMAGQVVVKKRAGDQDQQVEAKGEPGRTPVETSARREEGQEQVRGSSGTNRTEG